jgi:hypothetical protein
MTTKTKTFTLIGTDGTATPLYPEGKKKDLTLAQLQAAVGGPIERIELKGGTLWVNEEGWVYRLPYNNKASRVADFNAKYPPLDGNHTLSGPAVLVKNPSWKGREPEYNTTEQIDRAERQLKALFKGAV